MLLNKKEDMSTQIDIYPIVSIITVVYNDAKHITQTIESVLSQTYPNLEYIIIDGDSNDGTKEIIQNYIDKKPRQFKHFISNFISEKDKGIYDAMNKGIRLATGEWCNFMNSGDRFYQNITIQKCFEEYQNMLKKSNMKGGGAVVIYGHTQLVYDDKHSKILYCGSNNHKYRHKFIHQSAFIRLDLMKKYYYDMTFKIAADTDFFTKIYNQNYKFQKIDIIVSSFNVWGISGNISYQIFIEDCKIGYRYNKLFPIFLALKYMFYIIPRHCVKMILPAKLRNKFRIIFGRNTT